jgi:hypothetical protein
MSQSWKNLERKTARLLRGKRNARGEDFSVSAADVEHPLFSVECKYRKHLPALLAQGLAQAQRYHPAKPPLLVLKERGKHGEIVVLRLADFVDLFGPLNTQQEEP